MKRSLFVAMLVPFGLLVGCDQAAEDRAAQQAANSVREGNQALRELSAQVKQGSKEVVEAAKTSGHAVGEHLSDGAITARVKTALLADPSVDGMKIDVDTADKVVTLRGTLNDTAQSSRAEDIARRVEGVRTVQNQLVVPQAATPAPAS